MAQQSCSYCGGPFNGGNCLSCNIVGAGNEFVHDPNPFPYDNTPDFYDQPPQHHVETYSCELCGNDSHYGYDCPPRFLLESTIPLNEIISQLPQSIAITPVLPITEPDDSLIMRDEDLRTIPEKESDEFIKFSGEDLVPILSKSDDMTDSGSLTLRTMFSSSRGGSLDHFVEIPFGESKVHIEVLSVLWGNRLPILDGSLPLSSPARRPTWRAEITAGHVLAITKHSYWLQRRGEDPRAMMMDLEIKGRD
ncbi:hypothetical protein Tco_0731114 [Tanacetum coccineum]